MPVGTYELESLETGQYPLDERTVSRIVLLLAVLGLLFLLDIFTTHLILYMGGVELNPLMRSIVADPVLHAGMKSFILLLVLVVSLAAEQRVKGSSLVFYGTIILIYGIVVFNNVLVLLPLW